MKKITKKKLPIFKVLSLLLLSSLLLIGFLWQQKDTTEQQYGKLIDNIPMTVYKLPNCGCCQAWIDIMKEVGFDVKTINSRDSREIDLVKSEADIKPEMSACHTAFVDNFVFEGHVPTKSIVKFLSQKPAGIRGLAVPNMPQGSEGMEGFKVEKYKVYTLNLDGSQSVYGNFIGKEEITQ